MAQNTANNMAENKNYEYTNWQRMAELIDKEGTTWMWNPAEFDKKGMFIERFKNQADAEEYARLKNEIKAQRGREVVAYEIGTEDDFMAAAQAWSRKKKANEVKAYGKHADDKIKGLELEIKALKGLQDVCTEFDGKVINKRFHDAVKERTGFSNSFCSYSFELDYYGHEYDYNSRPHIYISADWSHGYNRYTGKPQEIKPDVWQWYTNDRMEARKAHTVIDAAINYRQESIANLMAGKKKYGEYLKKARQAEKLIKELDGFGYDIRDWAKEHDLDRCCHAQYIWK